MDGVLTLSEAAKQLGLKAATLRSQIRFGAVNATKIGPIWVVSHDEVERYRDQHRGKYGAKNQNKEAA